MLKLLPYSNLSCFYNNFVGGFFAVIVLKNIYFWVKLVHTHVVVFWSENIHREPSKCPCNPLETCALLFQIICYCHLLLHLHLFVRFQELIGSGNEQDNMFYLNKILNNLVIFLRLTIMSCNLFQNLYIRIPIGCLYDNINSMRCVISIIKDSQFTIMVVLIYW